jgi:hypothetical protein
MASPAPNGDRIKELHERAVRQLVDAHVKRTDEPLILAVRYNLDDNDLYLLEVIDAFPGGDGDELFLTEFERSANLIIVGTLHLALGSPKQVEAAIARKDPIIDAIKLGQIVHDDGSVTAADLKRAIGL